MTYSVEVKDGAWTMTNPDANPDRALIATGKCNRRYRWDHGIREAIRARGLRADWTNLVVESIGGVVRFDIEVSL